MVSIPAPTPRHALIDGRWQIPLEELRAEKKGELAAARWQAEVSPFDYKGHRFDTSERSQIKYLSVKEPTDWKTHDGWIHMELVDFKSLVESYEEHVKGLFAKERTLCEAVEAAETAAALEAISWSMPASS